MERAPENGGTSLEDGGIQARSYCLGVRVLKLVRAMPRDPGAQVLARQVARSGTGVGANVEEAQSACSRREFIRKINIARTEARETHYWLRLIRDAGIMATDRLAEIIKESDEIVAILTAIERKCRQLDGPSSDRGKLDS